MPPPRPSKQVRSRASGRKSGTEGRAPAKIGSPRALYQMQRLMFAAISRKLTSGYHTQSRWVDGTAMAAMARQFIKPNDRLTSLERLEIYNRQYWFRLLDCLYDDFPGLRQVLGEKRFMALSREYLSQYPSRSFALRDLGRYIPEFLMKEPRWAGSRLALALDMVRLEWAQIQAFDGPALPVVDAQYLAGGDPARVRVKLQPYLSLLRLGFPLDEFSQALKRRDSLHTEAAESRRRRRSVKPVALPTPERIFLAVHRYDNRVFFKRLEEPAFMLLEELGRGVTVGAAVAQALTPYISTDAGADWPGRIKAWFTDWTSLGWLCR